MGPVASESESDSDKVQWRPRGRRWFQGVTVVGVLGAVAFVANAFSPDVDLGSVAVGAAMDALMLLAVWRFGLHPSVTAERRRLIVRNPFRTYVMDWAEVAHCTPTRSGMRIEREGQRSVLAWAVQKAGVWGVIRHRTRADEVAEFLNRRALRSSHHSGPHYDE
jgi:hypothetical protein